MNIAIDPSFFKSSLNVRAFSRTEKYCMHSAVFCSIDTGSFKKIGIVILDKSLPIASFRIAQIEYDYFSGTNDGNYSLILSVYDIGMPPNPICMFELIILLGLIFFC